jgi:hypothetical protein
MKRRASFREGERGGSADALGWTGDHHVLAFD